jgi:DNA polymerase III delta prime subunit
MIQKHFDKNNLHHAYLIEGEKEEIISELFEFIESIGINTKNNPDFIHISQDSFKIDDAKNLKSQSNEKAISYNLSNGQMGKKVFVISINSFLSDAQNTLLKMFEEPIENTMFFLIIPDTAIMLPTLLSRFGSSKESDGPAPSGVVGQGAVSKYVT